MLVVITINHIEGNPLRALTYQPFGYVSAAEGFVFISGLLAGYVYGSDRYTKADLKRKVIGRVGLIALVWAVACSLIHIWNAAFPQFILIDQSYLAALLFLPNPLGLTEILGLYLFLVGLLYFYISLLRSGYWVWLLMACFFGWSLTVVPGIYDRAAALHHPFLDQTVHLLSIARGYAYQQANFSLLAWQFLFVTALILGYYRRQGRDFSRIYHPVPAILIAAFLLFQFLVRHGVIDLPMWKLLAARIQLAPARLLAFFGIVYLVCYGLKCLKQPLRCQPLERLGRQSIYVYGFQLVYTQTLAVALLLWADSGIQRLLIVALALAGLYLTAITTEQLKRRSVSRSPG